MNILVAGSAGFIGSKISATLLEKNYNVIGIDNLNKYYDIKLKNWRLSQLKNNKNFKFYKYDICDYDKIKDVFSENKIDVVMNLAAQPGVRYSIKNPFVYFQINTIGNLNFLELCKEFGIKKFILASTSSLYAGQNMPFKEDTPLNTPISPYAASKKSAEVSCYTYHYLYGMNITILRYFTVYGPAGRPDMSPFKFIKLIMEDKLIPLYGDGNQSRDFTYIDDIVEGTIKAIDIEGFEIINLGNNKSYSLNYMINLIEKYLNKKARIKYKPFHKADMKDTCANIEKAKKLLNWEPKINFEYGIKKTIDWMQKNYDLIKNINVEKAI